MLELHLLHYTKICGCGCSWVRLGIKKQRVLGVLSVHAWLMDFQETKVYPKEKFARIAKFKGCQIFLLYGTVSLTTPLNYIYYTSTAKLVSCKIHCLPTMTADRFACEVFFFFSLVLSGGAACRLLHLRYLYRVMEMNSCGDGGDLDPTHAPDP